MEQITKMVELAGLELGAVLEETKPNQRWRRLTLMFYAGFLTRKQFTELAQVFGDDVASEEAEKLVKGNFDLYSRLGVTLDADGDLGPRSLVLDFNVLMEAMKEIKIFIESPYLDGLPEGLDNDEILAYDIWALKTLDNSTAEADAETVVYRLKTLEEYGFVKIGNWMFGRTIQNYILHNVNGHARQSEHVMIAMPYLSETDFRSIFSTDPSLDGGLQYRTEAVRYRLNTSFSLKHGVPPEVSGVMVVDRAWNGTEYVPLDIPDNGGEDAPFLNLRKQGRIRADRPSPEASSGN